MGYINSTIIPNEPPAVRMLCAWLVAFLELVAMVARPNLLMVHISGQIIATSHDLTPNGGLVREIPLFQSNLGW